jgi:hypothetical protein
MTVLLDPDAGTRLVKLLGLLGSDHDGERATAGAKADALIRSMGLTWRDVIALPRRLSPPLAPVSAIDWHSMAAFCFTRRAYRNQRELEFIKSMLRWRREPTERQAAWLISIYARLHRGADR